MVTTQTTEQPAVVSNSIPGPSTEPGSSGIGITQKVKYKRKPTTRIKLLSERDLQVLEYLSWGPSTVEAVGKKFFPPCEKTLKETLQNKEKVAMSAYVWQRLNMLQAAGYVQTQKGNNMKGIMGTDSGIVVLQAAGAIEVVRKFGYELGNIKQAFPKSLEVFHDIMVASTIRKFREEAAADYYKIEYIHTEHYVRKEYNTGMYSKGTFFPDFRIRVVPYKGPGITFDVEVDADSMQRGQFFSKISFFRNNVLIIAPNAKRMGKLFDYLKRGIIDKKDAANSKKKNTIDNREPIQAESVVFALWSNFVKRGEGGCRYCHVFNFPSGDPSVLPVVFK